MKHKVVAQAYFQRPRIVDRIRRRVGTWVVVILLGSFLFPHCVTIVRADGQLTHDGMGTEGSGLEFRAMVEWAQLHQRTDETDPLESGDLITEMQENMSSWAQEGYNAVVWADGYETVGPDKNLPLSDEQQTLLWQNAHANGLQNFLYVMQKDSPSLSNPSHLLDGLYLGSSGSDNNQTASLKDIIARTFQQARCLRLILIDQRRILLDDDVVPVTQANTHDDIWMGVFAWNGSQLTDAEPYPFILDWTRRVALPTVVSIYPANIYNFPFNSPRFAAKIAQEMKRVPNLKGFTYWEWSGRRLSPLFRKALVYYAKTGEDYDEKPWLDILEARFGDRDAARHLLKAFDMSALIVPEMSALIYSLPQKELHFPYEYFLGEQPGEMNTSPAPSRRLMSVREFVRHGDQILTTVPAVHMDKVRELGQMALHAVHEGIKCVKQNQDEAQQVLKFMQAYQLMSKYYERKVAAATAALFRKAHSAGHPNKDGYRRNQETELADETLACYLEAADFMKTNLSPILKELYGREVATPAGLDLSDLIELEKLDRKEFPKLWAPPAW